MTTGTRGDAAFKEAYASLNAAQKQAVDTIEGPVMVIAGPGTGKTQVLTLRIANILRQTDVQPENILALTFTDAGAQAMRERLRTFIGPAAYRVELTTFHSFASRLIAQYPDQYTDIIGGRPATDVERISILESILEDKVVKLLRPAGNTGYYIKPLLGTLSDLKRENVTPQRLSKLIQDEQKALDSIDQYHTKGRYEGQERGEYRDAKKNLEKNQALLHVYQRYEALLREHGLFDFDDMILETVGALENNQDMLLDLQEQYQYLLADEHQDVNGAQNRILELLASFHDSPNIFVVGDEKQAIYRFQGASLENFLAFESMFVGATIISLTDNYRSGQTVLDAAHDIITVEDASLMELRVPLTSKTSYDAALTTQVFAHQAVEDAWVAKQIESELDQGTIPSEIAVIVRNNKEVELLANTLRRAGIPVRASAESDILHHPVTIQVRALMRVIADVSDAAALFTILHAGFWKFSHTDLAAVLSAQRYDRQLSVIIGDVAILSELDLEDPEAFTEVADIFNRARKRQTTEAPHRVLEFLLTETGFVNHVMTTDPYDGARVLRRLYDEVESLVVSGTVQTLGDVVRQLSVRDAYSLPLTAPFITTDRSAVSVMTAHKSKGLEFEVVFMPHTVDSNWGGKNKRMSFKLPLYAHSLDKNAFLEDERRLFYVAMTRAKCKLALSSAAESIEGRELIEARLKNQIEPSLITPGDIAEFEKNFSVLGEFISRSTERSFPQAFIVEALGTRGFSATSFNNYRSSPWNFLFRNVFRIPEVQSLPLLFGTAMHNTIERMTRGHRESGVVPDMKVVTKLLEQQLQRFPLSAADFAQLHEKGLEALTAYREHLAATLPQATKEELTITVPFTTGCLELPEIPLTGKLDRVDIDTDGTIRRVVDYKTGKPKSRNMIEGKTKDSNGDYKYQLMFYALLLKLEEKPYDSVQFTLSFVEPDSKGSIREEDFMVTKEEVIALEEELRAAVAAIASGEAFATPCDPASSDYCDLTSQWT